MKTLLIASLFLLASPLNAAEAKPKYGPEAFVLSRFNDYVRENRAPDFWELIPYYTAQQDDRSCSVASVTMVVNGARSQRDLSSEDELATQNSVLKRVGSESWDKAVGPVGRGVSLDELALLVKKGLEAFGVEVKSAEAFHVENDSDKALSFIHNALVENEKSSHDFIVANFDQEVFTGDAHVGHIAPVGAYDVKRKRVLILDPDRQWYEPYWVSERTFTKGMDTRDSTSGKNRGFVWVKLK